MALLAAALLLCAPLSAQPAAPAPFTVAARRAIPGSGDVPLTLIVEERSAWNGLNALEKQLDKVSAIFARCGRTLGETQVLVVRWSPEALRRLSDADPYKAPPEAALLADPRLPAARPLGLLFAQGSVASTAKAFNRRSVGQLSAQFPQAVRMLDTFWITDNEEFRALPPDFAPSYSMTAHELAHILGNLEHTAQPYNLMTMSQVRGAKTGDLNDAQCAEIRTYPARR